ASRPSATISSSSAGARFRWWRTGASWVPSGSAAPCPPTTTTRSPTPPRAIPFYRAPTRVSGLVIVLTLPVNEQEGHLSYLSQSGSPAKETTVGGRTDDPRRERTRNAPARHRARASTGQRQLGVSRAGDLADGLLSMAPTPGTLRSRRRAPPPAAGTGGAPGGDRAGGRAAGARGRHQRGHLGMPTDRGLLGADLAGAAGAQHRAAAAAPGRLGHA